MRRECSVMCPSPASYLESRIASLNPILSNGNVCCFGTSLYAQYHFKTRWSQSQKRFRATVPLLILKAKNEGNYLENSVLKISSEVAFTDYHDSCIKIQELGDTRRSKVIYLF